MKAYVEDRYQACVLAGCQDALLGPVLLGLQVPCDALAAQSRHTPVLFPPLACSTRIALRHFNGRGQGKRAFRTNPRTHPPAPPPQIQVCTDVARDP